MDQEEAIAKQGLNLSGYGFKWRQAQGLVDNGAVRGDILLLPYWEQVRLTFLELGGEYDKAGTKK